MAKTQLQILPLIILIGAKLVQLRLAKLNLSPINFATPDLPDLVLDERLANDNVQVEKIGEGGELPYPECLVISSDEQYMFASLGDGRVARISNPKAKNLEELKINYLGRTGEDDENCGKGGPADMWPDGTNMESKCGRPLGLWLVTSSEGKDGDTLLVADAYKGLIMFNNIYGDDAIMATLATRADSDPPEHNFSLLNAVVSSSNGDIYLTETSTKHQRRRIFHAALEGHATGRLLRYRDETGKVEVVANNILMANGIAISHDKKSLLIVSGIRVMRFSIETQKLDTNPFIAVIPGTGDNIKTMDTTPDGKKVKCYWVALGSPYKKPFSLLKFLADKVWVRSFILAIVPYGTLIQLIPKWSAVAVYDEQGNLMETLRDDDKMLDENGNKLGVGVPWLSELEPVGDYVYLASWFNPFLARINRDSIVPNKRSMKW
jgi:hypothetical protein